ncbi:MAG: DUF2062 domain-containing protein [Myxococcota bacterium]|nr:DUF2062 domain-containing protein [Myxococcota bacterium]
MTAPIRLNWYRAVRSSEGSRFLAGGLGLGVFIAFYPILILHFPVVWGLAALFRLSRSAATAGVLLSNPLTIVMIWSVDAAVGVWITPGAPTTSPLRNPELLLGDLSQLRTLSWDDVSTMFLGATVVGLPAGGLSYLLAFEWLERRARRRRGFLRHTPPPKEDGHD